MMKNAGRLAILALLGVLVLGGIGLTVYGVSTHMRLF